jgi:hypothetical protein
MGMPRQWDQSAHLNFIGFQTQDGNALYITGCYTSHSTLVPIDRMNMSRVSNQKVGNQLRK